MSDHVLGGWLYSCDERAQLFRANWRFSVYILVRVCVCPRVCCLGYTKYVEILAIETGAHSLNPNPAYKRCGFSPPPSSHNY